MNWLRTTTPLLGGGLAAVSLWAASRYGFDPRLAVAMTVGLVVAIAPWALARLKRRLARWQRRRRDAAPVAYRAAAPADRETTRDRLATRLREVDALDARPHDFREGTGFAVAATGIHSTYVRVTADHVVVTGDDAVVDDVIDAIDPVVGRAEPVMANPLRRPAPVKGAPRVGVWITVLVAVLVASTTLTAAAYPPDAYNPAERTVLVGLDLHADLSPTVSPAEANLRKARFLVTALSEEAIEIRWLGNQTTRARAQAHDAAVIRADARTALDRAAAAGAPEPAVQSVERRLEAADARVQAALAETRGTRGTATSPTDDRATAHSRTPHSPTKLTHS